MALLFAFANPLLPRSQALMPAHARTPCGVRIVDRRRGIRPQRLRFAGHDMNPNITLLGQMLSFAILIWFT